MDVHLLVQGELDHPTWYCSLLNYPISGRITKMGFDALWCVMTNDRVFLRAGLETKILLGDHTPCHCGPCERFSVMLCDLFIARRKPNEDWRQYGKIPMWWEEENAKVRIRQNHAN